MAINTQKITFLGLFPGLCTGWLPGPGLALILALGLTGCAGNALNPNTLNPNAPLYQRLGGDDGVRAIVDETIDTVAADPRANHSFQKVDIKRLKGKIVEQICSLTGGGCKYSGDTMKQSHAGLNITEAEFYITVQTLRNVLDKRVGDREKNELLKILAPMKRDVVTG